MVAGLGRAVATTSHSAGLGRVRERTIALGPQVIAIDNIGTLEIVRGRRSWVLLVLGLLIAGGAASQINTVYQLYAAAGVGVGLLLIAINLMQRVQSGLAIGACDGRGALIVSRDEIFLQRLLTLLADKIDTRNESLLATFDIATGRINTDIGSDPESPFEPAISSEHARQPLAAPIGNGHDPMFEPAPKVVSVSAPSHEPDAERLEDHEIDPVDDGEDALFVEGEGEVARAPPVIVAAPSAPAPATEARSAVAPLRAKPAPRIADLDPLLDGRPPRASGDDWLSRPGPGLQGQTVSDPDSGGAGRVLLGVVIIVVLGAIVFGAWYFTGQTGSVSSISLTQAATPVPEIRGASEMETAPADGDSAAAESTVTVSDAPIEVSPYTPPEAMVARASGLRFRARPSAADDVPVVSETRTGGEALTIDGLSTQPDGEWYRVTLLDGRQAWFKASLAVPRARFADAIRSAPDGSGPFSAWAPRILEPAEGAQISGGAQTVRLAWTGRDEAASYEVEIEAYDAIAQRWISEPQHSQVTVESETELAEAFPSAGFWRWRVRAVSAAGEKSDVSRWAAFNIRN